jgi:predicted RNA binding protein YcfA (HicA-like mRNA interferase family)
MAIGMNNKDMEKIAKEARKRGWTITVTRGNHVKWQAPDGHCVFSPLTGSYRSWKNFRAMLKRNGFDFSTDKRGKRHV